MHFWPFQTQYEALDGKLVLDAGCGPGVLGLGAALMGAGTVTAMDIDEDALEVFHENVEDTGMTNIDAVQCDFLNCDIFRWISIIYYKVA